MLSSHYPHQHPEVLFRAQLHGTPGIAPVEHVFSDGSELVLAMPYYAGGDLASVLHGQGSRHLGWGEVHSYALQVGLCYYLLLALASSTSYLF